MKLLPLRLLLIRPVRRAGSRIKGSPRRDTLNRWNDYNLIYNCIGFAVFALALVWLDEVLGKVSFALINMEHGSQIREIHLNLLLIAISEITKQSIHQFTACLIASSFRRWKELIFISEENLIWFSLEAVKFIFNRWTSVLYKWLKKPVEWFSYC